MTAGAAQRVDSPPPALPAGAGAAAAPMLLLPLLLKKLPLPLPLLLSPASAAGRLIQMPLAWYSQPGLQYSNRRRLLPNSCSPAAALAAAAPLGVDSSPAPVPAASGPQALPLLSRSRGCSQAWRQASRRCCRVRRRQVRCSSSEYAKGMRPVGRECSQGACSGHQM